MQARRAHVALCGVCVAAGVLAPGGLLLQDTAQRFTFALESLRDQERRLTEIQLALQTGGYW